jgi:hypothetical protein
MPADIPECHSVAHPRNDQDRTVARLLVEPRIGIDIGEDPGTEII